MDKTSRLKEELRLTETGRDFLENVELSQHTNSLTLTGEIKPPIRINAIPIPEGATNGDMVKVVFNPIRIIKYTSVVQVYFSDRYYQFFGMSWWNAPYKKDCIPSEYDYSEDMELRNPQMHR